MQRDQHIAAIRAACIKANPERWNNPDNWEPNMYGDKFRLADILLAIDSNILIQGRTGKLFLYKNTKWKIQTTSWNLGQDDLTQQSDECIEFISSLLKA